MYNLITPHPSVRYIEVWTGGREKGYTAREQVGHGDAPQVGYEGTGHL